MAETTPNGGLGVVSATPSMGVAEPPTGGGFHGAKGVAQFYFIFLKKFYFIIIMMDMVITDDDVSVEF
jgi:hypothetical protein